MKVTVAILVASIFVLAYTVRQQSIEIHKLNCIHYVYEDGSVVHEDGELVEGIALDNYFEPLDDDELRNHLRLSLPPTDARAGWYFDELAMLKAIDYLGLKLPVRIRFMTGKYRRGTHYARADHHAITIHQEGILEHSNVTMWHELIHARQAEQWAERTGRPMNRFYHEAYKKAKGGWGYSYEDNSYEIEARQLSESYPFALIQGGR